VLLTVDVDELLVSKEEQTRQRNRLVRSFVVSLLPRLLLRRPRQAPPSPPPSPSSSSPSLPSLVFVVLRLRLRGLAVDSAVTWRADVLGFGKTWRGRKPAHIPQRGEGQGVGSFWADDVAPRSSLGSSMGFVRVVAADGVTWHSRWRSTGSGVVECHVLGVLGQVLVDPALVWPMGIREGRDDGGERERGWWWRKGKSD
jgi:hypothetical protein